MFPTLLEVDVFESVRCYLSRPTWQALTLQKANIRVPSEGFESSPVIELFFYAVCRTTGSAVLAFLERVLSRCIVYNLIASAYVVPKYELLGYTNRVYFGSGRFLCRFVRVLGFHSAILGKCTCKRPSCGDSALSYIHIIFGVQVGRYK
jgi:hypothetical protein